MEADSSGALIYVGEQFRVVLGGSERPAPPNRLVGMLLLLLSEAAPGWVSRRALGDSLYPGADASKQAAAVRQAFSRLRRWLPDADVQTRTGALRLGEGWTIDTTTDRGERAEGLRIAPGFEHPWMDEFRQRQGSYMITSRDTKERLLFEAIASVAQEDPETARNLLCSAAEIITILPETELSWLLGVTRPKSRLDPRASEHEGIVATVHLAAGKLRSAVQSYLRAYRIALQGRNFAAMASASSLVMFCYLELGEMESAAKWLTTLTTSDRAQTMHLLVLNAKSAFFWNNNQLTEALSTMRSARGFSRTASRAERAHYLSNLAVLEAEAGDWHASLDTIQEARTVLLGRQDRYFWSNLAVAEAEVLSLRGEFDRGLSVAEAAVRDWSGHGGVVSQWYLREAQAEIVHRQGAMQRARALWASVEADRLRECTGLTPRVAARKGRIFS